MRRFKGKLREDGVGYGQDAWPALHETFDGCSREALRAVHREMETMQTWSDNDPDNFLNKKDRCRDHPNSVTPEENLSDRQYEDIILQCLDQSTTEFARPTFRERTATFQAFGGGSRRSTPITSLASTPACQEVSRDEVSPYRRRGRTSAA